MTASASGPRFRRWFWAGVLILMVLLLALAFRPRAVAVEIGGVIRAGLTVTVRDEGRTRVRDAYVVSAPLAGRLLRIGKRAGDPVTAGEIIAGILPGEPVLLDRRSRQEAQAAVHTAQAALVAARAERQRLLALQTHARTEAARIENLYRREAVSQSVFDRARLELRAADAGVAGADAAVAMREAELEAARVRVVEPSPDGRAASPVAVRAPAAGRVLRILQQSEAMVAPGAPLVEVGDPHDLEVVVELLSSDAVQVAAGADSTIEGWGGPPLRGRVRVVEPYGFMKVSALGVEEQRVNVIIDLLDPPDRWSALGHGYRVEGAVTIWSADDVVQVPVAALFRTAGQWCVYRVDGNRVNRLAVEIGRNDGLSAQVLDGLQPGDRVVLHPGSDLDDGARIRSR